MGCHQHQGLPLLYVGISPSRPPKNGKPPSKQSRTKRNRFFGVSDSTLDRGQSWTAKGVELRPSNRRKPFLPSAKFIEHLGLLLVGQGVGALGATAFVEEFREDLTQLALVNRGTWTNR
jgi:hypothetical protein